MKNFGINLVGVPMYLLGTPKGGLVHKEYSGTWGDRGQGNELLSALENGLSWVGDKIVNFWDYVDEGLNKGVEFVFGPAKPTEKLLLTLQLQNDPNATLVDSHGNKLRYETNVVAMHGVPPTLPTLIKNPTPEIQKMYEGLKKLRFNWQVRESQLKKLNQLDKMESTATAKKYREAEQAYNNAVEEFKASRPHMKRMTSDVKLSRKQNASYKHNKANATDDMRAYNQGRPVLKERQLDYVEELMRKDPKVAGIINRYDIKVAKGMDKKYLRKIRKEMLINYAKTRKDLEYIIKAYE